MTDTNTETPEKNYAVNELLKFYDADYDPSQLCWHDAEFFENRLSLASADSTIHIVRIYLKMFALYHKRRGKTLFTRSLSYPMDNRIQIAETLIEQGFKLVGEHLDDHIFAKDDICISLFDNGYINAFSPDPRMNEQVFDSLNEMFSVKEDIVNRAYILSQSGGGYSFDPYPLKERELIDENYMPSVVADLPRLYAMVNSETPFGRLAILEGRPGGGKTSLIRGMMNEFGKPKFVVIPVAGS